MSNQFELEDHLYMLHDLIRDAGMTGEYAHPWDQEDIEHLRTRYSLPPAAETYKIKPMVTAAKKLMGLCLDFIANTPED